MTGLDSDLEQQPPMTAQEAVDRVLKGHGLAETPGGLHSWRCEHPDVYGKCTCYADLLDELTALAHDPIPNPQGSSNETPLARVIVVVDVLKGLEPARSNPSTGYEPSHEYVVIRAAEVAQTTAYSPTGILSALDEGYFEDPDPDGLLLTAVRDGLSELAPRGEESQP